MGLIDSMKYDPTIHHRRSIRLKGKDYGEAGAYFVTIVAFGREEIFGEIVNGEMVCNEFGNVARDEWFKTTQLRPNVQLYEDEFVVMPNHIHGIIWIVDNSDTSVGAERRSALSRNENRPGLNMTTSIRAEQRSAPTNNRHVISGSLGAIVRGYKSAVAYRINALRDTRSVPVWQRNYYEHIVRNDVDHQNIWDYMQTNPQRWDDDQLHQ
jgi:REP element-mobilizing transposase RayT